MLPQFRELFEAQVKAGRECTVRVGGFCMQPSIHHNALVTVRSASPETLQPGDVIAYFIETSFFVHRLMEKRGAVLVLKADSGTPTLHEVKAADILGKVIAVRNPGPFLRLWGKILARFRP